MSADFSFEPRSDRSGPSQGDQRMSVDGQLAEGVNLSVVQCRWAAIQDLAPPNKGQFGTAQATFQWQRHSTTRLHFIGLSKLLSNSSGQRMAAVPVALDTPLCSRLRLRADGRSYGLQQRLGMGEFSLGEYSTYCRLLLHSADHRCTS